MSNLKIQRALISVFNKEGLEQIIDCLHQNQVHIFSTGGTQNFIEDLNVPVTSIESLTGYPSILGGRVKTLHPKVFGGILGRKDLEEDIQTLEQYGIPFFDLVIVDLYPFEDTIATTTDENAIIEKIDIGGVSLIRAAAKNYYHTLVCCSKEHYAELTHLLQTSQCYTNLEERKLFATRAFAVTSHYDTCIFNYFNKTIHAPYLRISCNETTPLRYGENPHQHATYYGPLSRILRQLHGKELSYNNLLDIDAAVSLIKEFSGQTFVVIKHTNACGVAQDMNQQTCWKKALAGDPVSAFGGIIMTNHTLQAETAVLIDEIFFEVIIAPDYDKAALDILKRKKNRIILEWEQEDVSETAVRSVLNGYLVQGTDTLICSLDNLTTKTKRVPSRDELNEMIFAEKVCKHLKSNTIVLTRNKQLLGMGCGQTSRVDALKQAIAKAKAFGLDLKGATMASDAFFPFPDCVEIADKEGIEFVIQPGGSIKDQDTTDYCDAHNMCMVHTGIRHFKH